MYIWLVTLACLLLPWILIGCLLVRRADKAYLEFNEKEWLIDQLAQPALVARFLNATTGASFLLWIIDVALVQPALRRSLNQMEQAEKEEAVPPILCNEQARRDMKERVQLYYDYICASPTLTTVGKWVNYAGAYQCLVNHHGLLQLATKDPRVQAQVIKEPLFIVSLPRTGTTILHRTLAHDTSRFRNFDLCDMVCPLPHPIPRWDVDGRKAKAQEATSLIHSVAALYPGWKECLETMHGFRPAEADEDLGWYDTGLGHMYMDPLMKLYPEYRSQGSKLTSVPVAQYRYAWLKLILQLYQYTDQVEWDKKHCDNNNVPPCPTRDLPWLMKDPNHSAFLPQLLQVFPDAKLVFTHRPPQDIVASMAKLFVVFCSVEHIPGARGTTAQEWGQETLLKTKEYCNGMVEFTQQQQQDSPYAMNGANRIDFYFQNVVQDIPGTIDAIYKKWYSKPPCEEAKQAFREYLEQNKREKHGNQRRSIQDFHLTPEDVAFYEYNQLFLAKYNTTNS